MTSEYWQFIQRSLIFVYEQPINWWLVAIVFSGVLIPLFTLFMAFLRWLTGKATLI